MGIKIILSLISIIFSLIMIYVTQLNYKKKIFGKVSYLIWNSLWILVFLISIRPSIIDKYFENSFDINIFYILSVLSTLALLILYYFSYLVLLQLYLFVLIFFINIFLEKIFLVMVLLMVLENWVVRSEMRWLLVVISKDFLYLLFSQFLCSMRMFLLEF